MNTKSKILKTAGTTLLAEVAWELLNYIERHSNDIDGDTVELHDFCKPRLEYLLRKSRSKEQLKLWQDDDQPSNEPQANSTDGHPSRIGDSRSSEP